MPQAICRSSIEGCSKSSKLKAHDHLIFLWPPLTNRYPELILLGDCGPVLQDGGLSDGAAPDQGEDQEEDQAPQVLSYLIHSSYIYLIKGTRRRLWRSSAWRERLCCQASSWRRQTQLRWGVFTTLSLHDVIYHLSYHEDASESLRDRHNYVSLSHKMVVFDWNILLEEWFDDHDGN